MHAMVRSYSGKGASELMALLVSRKDEVEKILRGVDGLISYDLVTGADGGMTITVCRDKAGTDDSLARAKAWLKENASHLGVGAPKVSEGKVDLHIT